MASRAPKEVPAQADAWDVLGERLAGKQTALERNQMLLEMSDLQFGNPAVHKQGSLWQPIMLQAGEKSASTRCDTPHRGRPPGVLLRDRQTFGDGHLYESAWFFRLLESRVPAGAGWVAC